MLCQQKDKKSAGKSPVSRTGIAKNPQKAQGFFALFADCKALLRGN
jgi:hypothetical protein